jgi:signal transduction histidine kinase
LAYGVGLVVALVNVLTTSALMFLNAHDLGLLLLLLGFAAVISLAFAYVVAGALTQQVQQLSSAARRLAGGALETRVGLRGSDEIGQLAATFDDMAERLEQAFARQRALETSRRELVTAVSHDLRTPLATSRAMVEALADGVVTDPVDVRRYLKLILQEIQHLSRLIDDLFELSQIDSGALRLEPIRLEVADLVLETVAAYQLAAVERDIRLRQELDVDSASIQADPERLQRVLRNLLDNALRHTPPGGAVEVHAGADTAHVTLSVEDSGPGVPPEQLERIFDRFYRGEASRHRETGGAGLGLAIARGLVQAHHGRIWAEPSGLGGVAIRLELPRG